MALGDDASPGLESSAFAGDLLLALASDGRLSLDPRQAEEVVAGLQQTLEIVRDRLRILSVRPAIDHPSTAQHTIDAMFCDQVAPGQMEQALDELPKYIAAFRIAGQLSD